MTRATRRDFLVEALAAIQDQVEYTLPGGPAEVDAYLDKAATAAWWAGFTCRELTKKPSFKVLAPMVAARRFAAAKDSTLATLSTEATRRISACYGVETFDAEVKLRLRGGHTPAQDAERDRLRGVYRTLKAQIQKMPTVAKLEALDVISDAHWSPVKGE